MDLFYTVRQHVLKELESMVTAGELPSGLDMTSVAVEPPRDPLHGDMATNAAMVLSKSAKNAVKNSKSSSLQHICHKPGRG